MYETLKIMGKTTYQLVQDFGRQQYVRLPECNPSTTNFHHGAAMPQRSQLKPKQGWKASGDRKDIRWSGDFFRARKLDLQI